MPIGKDLKRRIRARMEKTGESYTTARASLLARKPPARSRAAARTPRAVTTRTAEREAPAPDLAALAGMKDAAVQARTGRTWAQWVETLDGLGAAARPHAWTARHLREEHALPAWWAQMVTVGYERIRGLRAKGQLRGGTWVVHKTKTYPVPLSELWRAFNRCKLWIGDAQLRMSKATREKSMRMLAEDGTPVDVGFWSKGPARSQVQLQHGGLASRADATRLRAFWTERLARLGEVLAASPSRRRART